MEFGKEAKFEVEEDILEYGIEDNVKKISEQLEIILEKSNSVAVKDMLKDIYNSFDGLNGM